MTRVYGRIKQIKRIDFFSLPFLIPVLVCFSLLTSCATVQKPGIEGAAAVPLLANIVEECEKQYNDVSWITMEEFNSMKDVEDWVIIDTRSEAERNVSIVSNALSVDEFEAVINTYSGRNILVYCTVGCRSGAYARTLQEKGFNAFNLWGGVLDWARSGREFVTPEGASTRTVHVFGEQWNVLPSGYQGVW
jgi:rhodanese-related sulfurtransferase